MASPGESQKRRPFSNLFKRKNKSESISPGPEINDRSSSAVQNNNDSAYASSEPPSTHNSEANIVPVENRGQIENVSADRNLALNKSTGDVLDRDTGAVVSTVTTTTTTTTTTTMKKGKDGNMVVDVQTQPAGQTSTNQPSQQQEVVEAPGDSAQPSHSRVDSAQTPATNGPRMSQPIIPPRSPHRRSREMTAEINHASTPAAAAGYNFSHPSRNSQRQSGDFNQMVAASQNGPSNRSTFESLRSLAKEQTSPDTYQQLKAAAKGLHGVGETIRGALNNELDQRIVTGDPHAQQAAIAKNMSVMDRGRAEMGRIPEQRESWATNNTAAQRPPDHYVSPIAQSQPQNWPRSRSASRSSGGKKGIRKLIKKKSR